MSLEVKFIGHLTRKNMADSFEEVAPYLKNADKEQPIIVSIFGWNRLKNIKEKAEYQKQYSDHSAMVVGVV